MKRIRVTIDVELPDTETDTAALTTGLFITEHCIEDTEQRNSGARIAGSQVALLNPPSWPAPPDVGDVVW